MTGRTTNDTLLSDRRKVVLICLFLIAATLAVYWPVRHYEFTNYDDNVYITENHYVQSGLTPKSISWALTARYHSNWLPLVWLSYMLDYEFYGLSPGGYHLTNVFLHIANSLLLFLVLRKMTGALWQCGFVASLFALHPLHVESVAWIAERKDVLSTFFWMLTMWSYARFVERPKFNRYLLVLLVFLLGLMAKPMLVTLPFVLLLLDYWPLGRLRFAKQGNKSNHGRQLTVFHAILEKIPLFFITTIFCFSTFLIQKGGGAVDYSISLRIRLFNAVVSYVSYLDKTIRPFQLAVLYPYPASFPVWHVVCASLFLVFTFLLAIRTVRKCPYFAVGWLWYFGTLIPVIGLVQVGMQAMADRYTYVPLIGIFIIFAWGIPDLTARWRHRTIGLSVMAAAVLLFLIRTASLQVTHWADSISLFSHAVSVTENNYVAHTNLGNELFHRKLLKEAIAQHSEALRINPRSAGAHSNLGLALVEQGKTEEAIEHYIEALRIDPEFNKARCNLGLALAKQDRIQEAIEHYNEALRLDPDFAEAHCNLGNVLVKLDRIQEAIQHYNEALRINPIFVEVHSNLGNILVSRGKIQESIRHYMEALRIRPDTAQAQHNLGYALARLGRTREAVIRYSEALRIKPDLAETHYELATIREDYGQLDKAIIHYSEVLRITIDHADAQYNLGNVLMRQGRIQEAVRHYSEALRIKPEYVEAHNNLGHALFLQDDKDSAVSHYYEALKIKPDFAEAEYNLGVVLESLGKFDEAIAHYSEALRIKPDFTNAQQELRNVKKMRGQDDAVTTQ